MINALFLSFILNHTTQLALEYKPDTLIQYDIEGFRRPWLLKILHGLRLVVKTICL